MILEVASWVTDTLTSVIGKPDRVHYVEGDLDAPYPFFAYHVPSYNPDEAMGAFDTDDREVIVSVQARSLDSLEAIRLMSAADDVLNYATPNLGPKWALIGKVRFSGGIPDPGNRLADNSLVYYCGNLYAVRVSRTRTDLE